MNFDITESDFLSSSDSDTLPTIPEPKMARKRKRVKVEDLSSDEDETKTTKKETSKKPKSRRRQPPKRYGFSSTKEENSNSDTDSDFVVSDTDNESDDDTDESEVEEILSEIEEIFSKDEDLEWKPLPKKRRCTINNKRQESDCKEEESKSTPKPKTCPKRAVPKRNTKKAGKSKPTPKPRTSRKKATESKPTGPKKAARKKAPKPRNSPKKAKEPKPRTFPEKETEFKPTPQPEFTNKQGGDLGKETISTEMRNDGNKHYKLALSGALGFDEQEKELRSAMHAYRCALDLSGNPDDTCSACKNYSMAARRSAQLYIGRPDKLALVHYYFSKAFEHFELALQSGRDVKTDEWTQLLIETYRECITEALKAIEDEESEKRIQLIQDYVKLVNDQVAFKADLHHEVAHVLFKMSTAAFKEGQFKDCLTYIKRANFPVEEGLRLAVDNPDIWSRLETLKSNLENQHRAAESIPARVSEMFKSWSESLAQYLPKETETVEGDDKQPFLDALKDELQELDEKQWSSDNVEFLKFVYIRHQPKDTKHKFLYEGRSYDEGFKKAVQKARFHYHPDKQDVEKHGRKWQVLCEEITKRVNKIYETTK